MTPSKKKQIEPGLSQNVLSDLKSADTSVDKKTGDNKRKETVADNTNSEKTEDNKIPISEKTAVSQNRVQSITTLSPSSKKNIKYIIFGCGSIGSNLIEELNESEENLLIIDSDPQQVQVLRDHRWQVMEGDMLASNLYSEIPIPEVAFILSASKEANLMAVKSLHSLYPQTNIIARSTDPFSTNELVDEGADVVLYPQIVFAKSAINHMSTLRSSRNAQRLQHLLAGWSGVLGILTHKNPDPDAISSAMALMLIAEGVTDGKLKCQILYEGDIGHQENRAFINMLEIKMEHLTPEKLKECDYLALIDSPGPGLNNDLPKDTPIQIIIDHHSHEGVFHVVKPDYIDIRPECGATASIFTQYIQELYFPLNTKVATALFHGIRSDTNEFHRNISPQDMHNAAYLLPFTDRALLELVMTPSMSQETLDILGKAILHSKVRQGYLFSNVGYIRNRDALPQAADLMLNLEGVNTALIYGITDTAIICSGRNRDIRLHLGEVMKEAFSSIPGASAGGHPTMAALSIPLAAFSLAKDKETLLDMIIDSVMSKFEKSVGIRKEDVVGEITKS